MIPANSSVYLKQLDGLRALSVAAVAWSHWRPYQNSEPFLPWGELGVQTFFIISGFLITGILLDNRETAPGFSVLQQFYLRRMLRVFPLFYAALVLLLIFKANSISETWPWHAAYLSNVYFYFHGWHGQLSHFWSLAVEEQFYLVWPLLLIFLPRKLLLPVILACIAMAPLFQIGMASIFAVPADGVTASVLMPSCLDALGIGALLAYGARENFPMAKIAFRLLLAGMAGLTLWGVANFPAPLEPLKKLAGVCVLGWLVYSAAAGFRGPFGRLLQSPPLNYLGKISYGLYVIHNFAISMSLGLIAWLGHPGWLEKIYAIPTFRMIGFAGLTIGLAALSWHVFEKPLNNLKRKFPYAAGGKFTSTISSKTEAAAPPI